MGVGGGSGFGLDVGNIPLPQDLFQRSLAHLGDGSENDASATDWMGHRAGAFNVPSADEDDVLKDWINFDDEGEENQAELEYVGPSIGNRSEICVLPSQDSVPILPSPAIFPSTSIPGSLGPEDQL